MDFLYSFNTTLPRSSENLVKREKLFNLIDDKLTSQSSFLLVSAPAGYGKTALLTEWIKTNDYLTAWFSVDANVLGAASFFAGIVASLEKVVDFDFKGTKNILQIPTLPEPDSVIGSLIAEIKLVSDQIILVIDDYHLIENQFIHQGLEKLLKFTPDNFKLIILTREDPPFMLHRYKIEGRMSEIRVDDLRFQLDEVEALLQKQMQLQITKADIRQLQKNAEGWISGLRLVAMKLKEKDKKTIHDFVVNFSGSHYYIIDYLVEEVLSELDDTLQEFLFKTSVVERLNADLCNFLTDKHDSAALLKNMEDMNLFIFAVDAEKKWFRYHNLFRDSLITNLTKTDRRKLHSKAANWFNSQGMHQEAINQAIKAVDFKLAVIYLTEAIPELLEKGSIKLMAELLDLIPDQYLKESGQLMVMKAWVLFVIGKRKDVLYYVNLLNHNPDLLDNDNRGRLMSLTALLPEINVERDPEEMAIDALTLIAERDKIFKINALMSLGQIQAYKGKLKEAIATFKKSYYLAREAGQVFMEMNSLMNLALKLNQRGSLQEAITLCEENIIRYKNDTGYLEPLARLIYIPLGILLYHKGDYMQAKDYLIKGVEISEQLKLVHVSWMPKIFYAQSCYKLGEKKLAYEIINDTLQITNEYNLKPNYLWAENVKIEFDLYDNKHKIGDEKILQYQKICENELNPATVRTFFTYTRILLSKQENEKAIACLEKIKKASNDYLNYISVSILLALAFWHTGQKIKTKKYLSEAMTMAGREGYLTPFIEEGKLIIPLLKANQELAPVLVRKILARLEIDEDANKLETGLVDPLTDREVEILALVGEGLANKKIADKLFITQGTTKWHLSNIYSKLGVRNRTKAAFKARELGLID